MRKPWDQVLKPHLHLHALVPGGALADGGQTWNPTAATCLFPVKRLCRQKWIVYAKPPFGSPEQKVSPTSDMTLSDLGCYTHRVAISNHRLLDLQGERIRFTFRNHQKDDRVEMAQLEAHAFIKRFLLHVLPSGFVRVRHYGLLANRCKAYTLPLCRQALGPVEPPTPPESQSVVQAMQSWTGSDITRCPACGHQPLERIPVGRGAGCQPKPGPTGTDLLRSL